MGNMIPQKSFDAQMHIIRDVHFDVDKYKVGELYAIKYKTPNALTIDEKIVGKLTKVERDALTFDIFERCPLESIPEPDMRNHYTIETLILSIDLILRDRIEVERLLTVTEAAVYLSAAFVKGCANDLFKSQIDWQEESIQQHTKNDDDDVYYVEFENHKSVNLFDCDGKFNTDAFRGCKDYKRMNISFIKSDSKFDVKMSTSNLLSISTERLHFGNKACCAQIDLFANSARDMFDEIIIKFIQ